MRLLACLPILFAACGSDDGTPPSISALQYSPATVAAGQQATVSGTLLFEDEDGDLSKLRAEATLPDGSRQQVVEADLGSIDQPSGTLTFALILVPPQAGTYQFSLWVTDDGGNDSNHLDGTLVAQ